MEETKLAIWGMVRNINVEMIDENGKKIFVFVKENMTDEEIEDLPEGGKN